MRQGKTRPPFMPLYEERVLVVGTTPDYVQWIRQSCPKEALFLTDPAMRNAAEESPPPPFEEILCDLTDEIKVIDRLADHLRKEKVHLSGVASFDCESMRLSAILAGVFNLPYPSVAAIDNCRDKYSANRLWREHNVACPEAALIQTEAQAYEFFDLTCGPCVFKPRNGSGSELVFIGDSPDQCRENFHKISTGLRKRRDRPMYKVTGDFKDGCLAEKMIGGEEYSCDFIIENEQVSVIRICRKILSSKGPFGTTRGYVLHSPVDLSDVLPNLSTCLYLAATALGFSRALCMADFKAHNGNIVFLEMTPRPGGDCLPSLLRRGWQLDILKANLDFARGFRLNLPKPIHPVPIVGMRIHAQTNGAIKVLESGKLLEDPRVLELHLFRKPGHQVLMPPEDYDSWLLGHAIFKPSTEESIASQCDELLEKLDIEME
jgi:biotin carboxylase